MLFIVGIDNCIVFFLSLSVLSLFGYSIIRLQDRFFVAQYFSVFDLLLLLLIGQQIKWMLNDASMDQLSRVPFLFVVVEIIMQNWPFPSRSFGLRKNETLNPLITL